MFHSVDPVPTPSPGSGHFIQIDVLSFITFKDNIVASSWIQGCILIKEKGLLLAKYYEFLVFRAPMTRGCSKCQNMH